MFWIKRLVALLCFATVLVEPARSQETAGPPEWDDGASVYLKLAERGAVKGATSNATAPTVTPEDAVHAEPIAPPELPEMPAAPIQHVDSAVTPPIHEVAEVPKKSAPPPTEPASATDSRRRLKPASARATNSNSLSGTGSTTGDASAVSRRLADFGLPAESMFKIGTGLAIVIGAFLLFAWAIRRGGRAAGRGSLPTDVVSVLGRVPLAARQFAELLRVGNKLVLVSITPTGAQTLTEVTDPAEVDRLVGLCQQNNPHSTTKAFEQVFRQLSNESAPSGFLGGDAVPSFASPAGAYRTYRGETARG
jgi:flagellar biogenesis protein FliO